MPLTPNEAIAKNAGKKNLQFERAIRDLLVEIEEAVAYYTGNPVYVGLPSYLQYKVQADNARDGHPVTLTAIDEAVHARVGPAGWKVTIVTNHTESYYWAKLRDARED